MVYLRRGREGGAVFKRAARPSGREVFEELWELSSVRRSRPRTVAARRGGEILGMRSSRLLAREGLNSKDYLLIRPLLQILSRGRMDAGRVVGPSLPPPLLPPFLRSTTLRNKCVVSTC